MIDVKQAVGIAVEYLKSLYDAKELPDLMLEEVELSEEEQFWFVTLSFTGRELPTVPLQQAFFGKTHERVYKIIKIKADNGQVLSMKMRKHEHVS